jgi:alkylresorcinol/alkylpyrone synthase
VSRIAAAASALPAHHYRQHDITAALLPLIAHDDPHRAALRKVHASSGVESRHLALPLEQYGDLESFGQSNDAFIAEGTALAERAVRDALERAGVDAADVDFLLFTTVTGVSAPSIDAALVRRLGMRDDVKRLPSFGLGCVAGAAALARAHDYLEGHPDEVALVVSVELCSLTVQRDDDSMANLVASALFGDGAAAVVLTGDERDAARSGGAGPRIVDTRSRLYADTEGVLGWDVGGTGFRIVLSAGVPAVIDGNFAADAAGLLSAHGLAVADIGLWIAHPGGPKVLDSFQAALGIERDALEPSWQALRSVGNLSSAAVLHILAGELASGVEPGTRGLLFALGPGVTAELVLLDFDEAAA